MRYLRRFLWFLASRLFVLVIVLGLLVTGFYYAMNLTNVQIVLKDGMARRAQVVMGAAEAAELPKYFQVSFLEQDAVTQAALNGSSPYVDYNVVGIDHRIEMSFVWIWPWDDMVTVEIVERIPSIDGRARGSRAEALVAANGPSAVYPPAWHSARYTAVLLREGGAWKIRSLSLISYLD